MTMHTEAQEIKQENKVVKESLISRIRLMLIMIITAILIIISILVNINSYSLEINESVKISRKVVEIMGYMPQSSWLLIILIICLLYSIYRKGIYRIIGYMISLVIIEIGIELAISELMLENVTNLYLVNIHHVIPLETRLDYLNLEMIECYKQSTLLNTLVNTKLENIAKYIETNVDMLRLNGMNARDITYYARELFINAVISNDMHNDRVYESTINVAAMITALYIFASTLLIKFYYIINFPPI
jgi:hypothetical protein